MSETPFQAQKRKLQQLRAKQSVAEDSGALTKKKKKKAKKKTGTSSTD